MRRIQEMEQYFFFLRKTFLSKVSCETEDFKERVTNKIFRKEKKIMGKVCRRWRREGQNYPSFPAHVICACKSQSHYAVEMIVWYFE